jgi:hypothetical protein
LIRNSTFVADMSAFMELMRSPISPPSTSSSSVG